MVILISGHSCTGKTLMSQNLLEKYNIPYYSIDHIKMGIFRADEGCGFTPSDSNEHIGNILWPIIKGIIMTSIENNQNIIIEGCYLLPQFLEELEEDYLKQIVPIFIGFTQDYIEDKFHSNIIGYRSVIEKRDYEEDRSVQNFVDAHEYFKVQCEKHKVKYFEIHKDYENEIEAVYAYIDSEVERLSLQSE